MPSYIMNVIKFPKSFCRRICANVARFWWAASGKERGIHWKKWDSITESKRDGGLGFKDLEKQNTAYLAKQAWRALKNPNAIWVQILKSIYFPGGNFWTAKGKKGASWVWKSILHGRELLRENAKWSIGDGSKVSIWKDNWIAGRSGPLNINSTDDARVKDLIVSGEGWNKRKIESKFSQEICNEILSTPVSAINREDNLYWPWREDGNYSIRTGYYAARRVGQGIKFGNPSTSEDKREIWKEVWRIEVPQKIRMFIWKACHDILPVGSNLYKRKMASDPICQICLKSSETVEHALLLCDWARATWFGAECQWIPTKETVTSIGNWMVECIKKLRAGGGGDQERRISKLGFLMWEIWKTRNSKIFQQQQVNPRWTICRAIALEATYWKLAEKQQTQKIEVNRSKTNLLNWRPPPENWLKANVDAAFKKDTGRGAISVVIRDHKGRIILGFSGKIQAKSSIIAEAQAIRQALIIVNNLQIGRTLIESDNLKLVQAIKSNTALGEALAIIQDIHILMESLPEKGITWTPRNGNRLAHAVAKAAESDTLQANWSIKPPIDIQSIITREAQM
ncbi:Putative ribonuclease H protein [Arachis hypogaea]|nr:Putative ribonuclease H protein [Arachis hypogaea]